MIGSRLSRRCAEGVHSGRVVSLEPLDPSRAQAILEFELDNRSYFSASISDRGDDFFDEFDVRYRAVLEEQAAGRSCFYALVGDDGDVLGRFNLYDIGEGSAEVGYRVAQRVAGRGVATSALRMLCAAAAALKLRVLTAATSDDNHASQRVLAKAGFTPCGPARPADIGGKTGTRYRLVLQEERSADRAET